MTEVDDFVGKIRRVSSTPGKINAQRRSFVLGSAALDDIPLTRSTISSQLERTSTSETSPTPILETQNLIRQYDFIVDYVRNTPNAEHFRLDSDLVRRLHQITFEGVSNRAGNYRQTPIAIAGASHAAPAPSEIPALIDQMCKYVNYHWRTTSYLHLGAFVLWRLLWIHPFEDGNGRVARALSYLIICVAVGTVIPGTPTLPELIVRNRTEYYSALEHADEAQRAGVYDVSRLEALVGELLERQISNSPQLSDEIARELETIIDLRIRRASETVRVQRFGSADLNWQLWSLGEYLILHVNSHAQIAFAGERQREYGEPFPDLLAVGLQHAEITVTEQVTIFANRNFLGREKPAVAIAPDACLTIVGGSCEGRNVQYALSGAVYVMRFGPRSNLENCPSTFDFLIARHITSTS
jgi:Fic family protein